MDTILAGNLNLTNFRSHETGITASPTQTQAAGTQLKKLVNRVDTVASANDAVCLPPAVAGLRIVVINNTATQMGVFPFTGDEINALGADAVYAQAGHKVVEFIAAASGQSEGNANGFWYTNPA